MILAIMEVPNGHLEYLTAKRAAIYSNFLLFGFCKFLIFIAINLFFLTNNPRSTRNYEVGKIKPDNQTMTASYKDSLPPQDYLLS